tara:strand:- start:393 stop:1406 length:1014 start_codon:yes stop_codon:yes gene_type:complete
MNENIQFVNKPKPYGGPSSFQIRLINFLTKKNFYVTFSNDKKKPDLLFLISSTKKYLWIISNKIKNKKIIQRLDGFLWKHKKENVSIFFKIKCELMNLNMIFIRKYLADHIVYQSQYLKDEWDLKYGKVRKQFSIIHNAASNDFFRNKINYDDELAFEIICVEGAIQNDKLTLSILKSLEKIAVKNNRISKINVYGDHSFIDLKKFSQCKIEFHGLIPREKVSEIYNKPNLIFFMLEINPPCPNSLIESICAGIPSIGFDTGSYSELSKESGIKIKQNANLEKLLPYDLNLIEEKIEEMIKNYTFHAYKCIEIADYYRVERMGDQYLKIIENLLSKK